MGNFFCNTVLFHSAINIILKKIDVFIVSYKIGYRKPEKEIFHYTIEKIKYKPKEMIFVDDLSYNVKASIELGFNGILFMSNEKLKKELGNYILWRKDY